MKRILSPLLTLTLITSAATAANQVIPIGERPESIVQGFDGHYFVSVMNGQEPGDAVIKRWDGVNEPTIFATGLDEPKGICFNGERLFVSDLDRVWHIDAHGAKKILVDAEDFPVAVSYLNDTAISPDGQTVYVTDMGANTKMRAPDGALWPLDSPEASQIPIQSRVFQISLEGVAQLTIDTNPQLVNTNGIGIANNGDLLIAEFFKGNLFRAKSAPIPSELRLLNSGFRGADAIEQANDGSIYVSSWTQGKVWRLDSGGENPSLVAEGFQSAADFFLDETNQRILLPDMLAGSLVVIPLN